MTTSTRWKRARASRWFALVWVVPALLVLALVVVLGARALRDMPGVRAWLVEYPGAVPLPDDAPVGFPAWLNWQHFLNAFFLLFIFRTGWQLHQAKRPAAFWTRTTGPFRTKNPPVRIGIPLWFHLSLDAIWVLNGVVYIVLLFATGQWVRLVPRTWDIVPNAISAGLQYASLNWPTENGWVNYNALQLLAYFATVFIAAPLAIVTGVRMSQLWPARAKTLTRLYPIEVARALHLPVMFYFVAFTIVHVTLVLATGALRNLNHMFGGQDAVNWLGFIIFVVSLLVIVGGWFAARPIVVAPIAGLFGKVGR